MALFVNVSSLDLPWSGTLLHFGCTGAALGHALLLGQYFSRSTCSQLYTACKGSLFHFLSEYCMVVLVHHPMYAHIRTHMSDTFSLVTCNTSTSHHTLKQHFKTRPAIVSTLTESSTLSINR